MHLFISRGCIAILIQRYPNQGDVSGCIESGPRQVWGCSFNPATAPCPANLQPPPSDRRAPAAPLPTLHTATAGTATASATETSQSTAGFRMLGFDFDWWPNSKSRWGTCGALTSQLDDPGLLRLVSRLEGSLLRLGGSPADSLLYDVFDGACSVYVCFCLHFYVSS